MILRVEHLAWLRARPVLPGAKRGAAAPKSRSDILLEDEERGVERSELDLPPVLAGEYLIDRLFMVGPGVGDGVVTFQEMTAWCALTGMHLTAFEARAIRTLSSAYLSMSERATKPDCPPPYAPERPHTRQVVNDKLMAMFERLERQHAKGPGIRAARKSRSTPPEEAS